jgi:DNA-directed RNA polymerase II subunit RPB1
MNMHVPQSIEARVELEQLMAVGKNFITPQSNKPVMGIIQDSLVGSYLLTQRDVFFTRDEMMNMLMHIHDWDGRIPVPSIMTPTKCLWTGKQMLSILLPDIEYDDGGRRVIDDDLNSDDASVLVRRGELLSGKLTKKQLGKSYNGILHIVWKEHGAERLAATMCAIQRMVDYWLSHRGFSTGISDCVASDDADLTILPEAMRQVEETIQANLRNVEHPLVEGKIMQILNSARDRAGEEQLKHLPTQHGMRDMMEAGSKGSVINLSQITSCLGQQNVSGGRIAFGPKDRTLPHFKAFDYSAASKGFVKSSYIKGLSPTEFFQHAQAGREGIIDTACKTATSGYTERKMVKNLENIKVEYDGTVRNADGRIIQFVYGDDGCDGIHVEHIRCNMPAHDVVFWTEEERRGLSPTLSTLYAEEEARLRGAALLLAPHNNKEIYLLVDTARVWARTHAPLRKEEEEACASGEALLWVATLYRDLRQWSNPLLEAVVAVEYASKRVLAHSLVRLQEFSKQLLYEIQSHMVHPGEMVGVLSAQSIAEPATQMVRSLSQARTSPPTNSPLSPRSHTDTQHVPSGRLWKRDSHEWHPALVGTSPRHEEHEDAEHDAARGRSRGHGRPRSVLHSARAALPFRHYTVRIRQRGGGRLRDPRRTQEQQARHQRGRGPVFRVLWATHRLLG